MALKPNGNICSIREQIIEDPVSGLTLQFIHKPGTDAPYRLYIFGNIPHGNREILFDRNGAEAGAGTALTESCRPGWLKQVEHDSTNATGVANV
jgi:hypothetical protein